METRRDFKLVLSSTIGAMGGREGASRITGKAPKTVDCWYGNTEQDIPVKDLQKILAASPQFPDATPHVFELLHDHICRPASYLPVRAAAFNAIKTDFNSRLEALVKGVSYFAKDDLPTQCSGCGAPVILIPVDGRPEPVCTKRCRR